MIQAQLIAQSIGQAFSVAYQEFLRANGINPEDLSQKEYSDLLNTQDMYNDDLIHFSKSENCKDVSWPSRPPHSCFIHVQTRMSRIKHRSKVRFVSMTTIPLRL